MLQKPLLGLQMPKLRLPMQRLRLQRPRPMLQMAEAEAARAIAEIKSARKDAITLMLDSSRSLHQGQDPCVCFRNQRGKKIGDLAGS